MTSRSQQSRAATQSLIFGKPTAEPRDLDTAHAVEPPHKPNAPPRATDCQIADESGQVAGVTEQFSRQCLNSSSDQRQQTPQACPRQKTGAPASAVPDFMLNQNAVLGDQCTWRHGKTPNYAAANAKFAKERLHKHAPGALADMVSNLVKNWEKEASYKTQPEDWRTIDHRCYQFSCNGGRKHTAAEMTQIGTYNALIGEHAFYSSSNTSFDDSHTIFRESMPNGFAWEVTEVYSGPPLAAFKWRHWGEMTGDLTCPMGPGMKLTAPATHQPLEIFGICIAKVNAAFQITDLEIYYDPHDLMAKLCSARSLALPALNAANRAVSSHDGGKDSLEHDSDRWSEFTSERGDDTPRVSFDLPPGAQLEQL